MMTLRHLPEGAWMACLLAIICCHARAEPQKQPPAALEHGGRQFREMLSERPQMAVFKTATGMRKLDRDAPICLWAIRQFGGEGALCKVYWTRDTLEGGTGAGRFPGMWEGLVSVSVAESPPPGTPPEEAFECLWVGVTYELLGLAKRKEALEIYKRAVDGRLDRSAFIKALARHEYECLLDLEQFWKEHWKPWADSAGFTTSQKHWFRRRATSFEVWYAAHEKYEKSGGSTYPEGALGSIYDWLKHEARRRE